MSTVIGVDRSSRFEINTEAGSVTCPAGVTTTDARPAKDHKRRPATRFVFAPATCAACPLVANCTKGNRFYYSLARRAELKAFVGEMPAILPERTAMLNVARELVDLERRSEAGGLRTLPVHASTTLRLIREDLDELGIDAPSENVQGVELWPALRQLGAGHLGAWSIGQWPSDDPGEGWGRPSRPAAT